MDPTTVIIVLALHLISTGGLFYLIGRQMPARSGLGAFALGTGLFGSAYALRLLVGLGPHAFADAVLDLAMVLAGWMFLKGLQQFVDRSTDRVAPAAAAMVAFLVLHVGVVAIAGVVGRHVLLNAVLGLTYIRVAYVAAQASKHEDAALGVPLRVLLVLMVGLGGLTLMRAGVIATHGTAAVYRGAAAQVYYAYASLAAVMLGPNLLWMVFVRLNRQLADLATHDPLTRLLNRSGWDDVLRRHFSERRGEPVTLLQVDVDHFKRINDTHGHAAGDAVLLEVAATLQSRVRAGDFVARTGGEEFLVGCVGGDLALAQALAERLREAVAQLRTPRPDGQASLQVTVSVGISRPFEQLAHWQGAAEQADRALYVAKQAGRDRVAVAPVQVVSA